MISRKKQDKVICVFFEIVVCTFASVATTQIVPGVVLCCVVFCFGV